MDSKELEYQLSNIYLIAVHNFYSRNKAIALCGILTKRVDTFC